MGTAFPAGSARIKRLGAAGRAPAGIPAATRRGNQLAARAASGVSGG
jgi:hypothetical protein